MHEQAPIPEDENRFRDINLGRITVSASMGIMWGVGTFEGLKVLDKLFFNQPFTSPRDQLAGLAIFGIGGGAAVGRFVYKQISREEASGSQDASNS